MGEHCLRRHLAKLDAPALVRSAGFLEGGRPAEEAAVQTSAAKGLDLSGHVSRQLTPTVVRSADLVLAMTSEHVRDLMQMNPDGLGQMFTLGSFVRLAIGVGPRTPDVSFSTWVAQVASTRTSDELFADTEDISDPMGRPIDEFRKTFILLDRLLFQVASLAYPRIAR